MAARTGRRARGARARTDGPRGIAVDLSRQLSSLARLRAGYRRMTLTGASCRDRKERELVALDRDVVRFSVERHVDLVALRLTWTDATGTSHETELFTDLVPDRAEIFLRVDADRQLELVTSEAAVVAKVFRTGATASHWPHGLRHACADGAIELDRLIPADAFALASLTTVGNGELRTLDWLTRCPNLVSLSLARCGAITDLGPLAKLRRLEFLDLTGCASLRDVAPLGGLRALFSLDVAGCAGVTRLAPLAGARRLVCLDVSGVPAEDLSTLLACPGLCVVNAHDAPPAAAFSERTPAA